MQVCPTVSKFRNFGFTKIPPSQPINTVAHFLRVPRAMAIVVAKEVDGFHVA